ncbi:hypothetical protein D0S48_18225 [Psychrobacillus sp. AK 1817]|uniref:hypothetical protein n=1 Tax=Psychrobacillus sp. AK 1817 TaxID=2303505 RepID=UPI0012486A34|nr:hypothetical protein [Psychrobacillus sp. AK 1817]QEY22437.1 hypothetical protein D0S48_18225 [Psychrobacillus sp. AK 1817]
MNTEKKSTTHSKENTESFIMISKSLIETKRLGKNGELDVYHLAIIKSIANNFQGVAYTGVTHLMKFIGMNTEQNKTRKRTKDSLLRLQEMGHIEIYENIAMENIVEELKPSNNYFVKPTGKDEDWGFAKVFYNDIQKIVAMKSDYKPKIFATYLNMIGNIFYGTSNVPISYTKIDTIVKSTGINRKSVVEYLKALYEEEILNFVYFQINNSVTKNYCTRWIHREYTSTWAAQQAEFHYKTYYKEFKSGGVGVSDERGVS